MADAGAAPAPAVEVLEEDGLRKAINGYTWPGIEYGEPPSCAYTFFEYIDALRLGDLPHFLEIEAASAGWYSVHLDRGAGAALHFAADHGRLDIAKFLIEQRGAAVNQRDRARGWTPLMRCARVAHYKHAPFLELFEYLLQKGADPSIRSFSAAAMAAAAESAHPLAPLALPPPEEQLMDAGLLDLAVQKGFGWEPGAVRAELARLVEKYEAVPKQPVHIYTGPHLEEPALELLAAWQSLPKLYPPTNWRPPPPAGYQDAQGVRRVSVEGWRPAGDRDGSAFLRPMTKEELAWQAENC